MTKDIPSMPGYSVSECGTVVIGRSGRRLAIRPNRNGYSMVGVSKQIRSGQIQVHQMVCEAWNGPRNGADLCRHLDGDRTRNHADNLAWGTYAENNTDTVSHGRAGRGSEKRTYPRWVQEVCEYLAPFNSQRAIGKALGISHRTVGRTLKRYK